MFDFAILSTKQGEKEFKQVLRSINLWNGNIMCTSSPALVASPRDTNDQESSSCRQSGAKRSASPPPASGSDCDEELAHAPQEQDELQAISRSEEELHGGTDRTEVSAWKGERRSSRR